MVAPLLVVAIGNASRGDDALGPALAAALRGDGCFEDGQAELLEAYQLQIEDALALAGRRAVLFVDAAHRGDEAVSLVRLAPPVPPVPPVPCARAARASAFTHALAPAALLDICARVLEVAPPPAWLLAIVGERFELGAPLSTTARVRLALALALARAWLDRVGNPLDAAKRAPRVPADIAWVRPSRGAAPEAIDDVGAAPSCPAGEPACASPGRPWPR